MDTALRNYGAILVSSQREVVSSIYMSVLVE